MSALLQDLNSGIDFTIPEPTLHLLQPGTGLLQLVEIFNSLDTSRVFQIAASL